MMVTVKQLIQNKIKMRINQKSHVNGWIKRLVVIIVMMAGGMLNFTNTGNVRLQWTLLY